MNHYITFNVVSTGNVADGFEASDVRERLIKGLRLAPEQAKAFLGKPRVLKKGLMKADADKLAARLANLGIVIEVQKVEPQLKQATAELALAPQPEPAPPPPSNELSLEPMEGEAVEAAPQVSESAVAFRCPKCDLEQPKSEQCTQCGVWFHKLEQSTMDGPSVAPLAGTGDETAATAAATSALAAGDEEVEPDSALNLKAIAAAAGVALLGALVWKFIAVTFDYEFGLIAWAIGGAVGFAAASLGSRGVQAGVLCGALAFASIGLGKYWMAQSFIDEFQTNISSVMGDELDLVEIYDEFVEDARLFAEGSGGELFTRQYMVDRNYSEASDPADVSREELQDFEEYYAADLRDAAQTQPTYEQWKADALSEFNALSPWEFVKESLGLFDILFLLLGVGTAFRLGGAME